MKKYQDVFERYEKKYLLSRAQYRALRAALAPHMEQDAYGKHTICNLYFDTEQFSLIRHSLDKPLYKEKLRLRSYGIPQLHDTVYVELKKKFAGVVYKRRVGMTLTQAYRYLLSGIHPAEECQIVREIDWFMKNNPVFAAAYIAYDRVALFGKEDNDLRITFDEEVRAREHHLDLLCGDYGTRLLEPGAVLMEAKLPYAMPLWLSHVFSECGVQPGTFSKYGACYTEHILKDQIAQGGVFCA